MKESTMEVKFKNNHKKLYDVLFTMKLDDSNIIVYSLDEVKNGVKTVYAAKIVNDSIEEIKDKKTKELVEKVLENFNKGV